MKEPVDLFIELTDIANVRPDPSGKYIIDITRPLITGAHILPVVVRFPVERFLHHGKKGSDAELKVIETGRFIGPVMK